MYIDHTVKVSVDMLAAVCGLCQPTEQQAKETGNQII